MRPIGVSAYVQVTSACGNLAGAATTDDGAAVTVRLAAAATPSPGGECLEQAPVGSNTTAAKRREGSPENRDVERAVEVPFRASEMTLHAKSKARRQETSESIFHRSHGRQNRLRRAILRQALVHLGDHVFFGHAQERIGQAFFAQRAGQRWLPLFAQRLGPGQLLGNLGVV